ncbi:MAG: chemotaxis-specific protein-glutamate methyltransferase CheB [Planctomycetota bacterium]
MIRVGIVNDVKLAAEVLRRVVVSLPEAEVAWIAENGAQAVARCQADRPDLVLMDLLMPVMDGVEATHQIMQRSPCPILVVTATVSGNSDKVFDALGHGALDTVNTPVLGRDGNLAGGEELVQKIRNIVRLRCGNAAGLNVGPPPRTSAESSPPPVEAPLLVIGASTGGPQAVASVLARGDHPLPYSVVLVQHLDPRFVPGLTDWLSRVSGMSVRPIGIGERPQVGKVHVACTENHLALRTAGDFQYVREPADHVYRPSVDVFFHSLLRAGASPGVAVLLTGMGRDGAAGMKALQQAGWRTIAQDEDSSVVWGMPRAAIQLGAADDVLPLDQIGPAISKISAASQTP